MIVIQATPTICKIASRTEPWLSALLRDTCAYDVPGSRHSQLAQKRDQWGEKIWDGKVSLYDRQKRTFLTGVLPRIEALFKKEGVEYEVRHPIPQTLPEEHFKIANDWLLRDYQIDAANRAMSLRRCMVQMATGGGKTITAGYITAKVGMRTLFLVHTRDLLMQAIDAFSSMFGEHRIGQIGDGKVAPGPITVATIQTMSRIYGVKYARADEDDLWDDKETKIQPKDKVRLQQFFSGVGLVFMDECHRVASPTAEGVLGAIQNAPYRIGLSASPWRDDGADIVLEGVFGQVGCEISASNLIDRGFLVRPVIRMLPVPAEIFERGTAYDEIYSGYVVENTVRNTMGVRAAARMVKRGRATMVLVRRIGHGEQIAEQLSSLLGFSVPFLSGRDDTLLRKEVLDDIRGQRLGCMVASTIADEGLDIRPLSGLVLLGGGKSSTRALQRVGRVLRTFPGKEDAEVVDFNDRALHLMTHSMAREKIYASEPRFLITDV